MRDLKGDWRDLFNGFMLALDLRKMFLGLCAILFTVFGPLGFTCWIANKIDAGAVNAPQTFVLGEIWGTICQSWHVIYSGTSGHPADWKLYIPYSLLFVTSVLAIWAYFGGAIARNAAYEIGRDGERIETARALGFAGKKFWSFFMSPWICVIGALFFFLCNFAGGALGRVLDLAWIGGPIVALLLPLALLSGFIMTLISVGTVAGFPLFAPAVAAEGTDAFDAVSRGFSYVYSRPWHYLWYQVAGSLYGVVCSSFVILFAILMCHFGLQAGAAGFDTFAVEETPQAPASPADNATPAERDKFKQAMDAWHKRRIEQPKDFEEKNDRFQDIANTAWAKILSREHATQQYGWCPSDLANNLDPYGRLMNLANCIVKPNHMMHVDALNTKFHKVAAWLVMAWLVITLGLALGYIPSYVISHQTIIYFLLRKKVDGIEMNEVYEEPEEGRGGEPVAASDKPAPPPAADAKPAPPPEQKPPA